MQNIEDNIAILILSFLFYPTQRLENYGHFISVSGTFQCCIRLLSVYLCTAGRRLGRDGSQKVKIRMCFLMVLSLFLVCLVFLSYSGLFVLFYYSFFRCLFVFLTRDRKGMETCGRGDGEDFVMSRKGNRNHSIFYEKIFFQGKIITQQKELNFIHI